MAEKVIDITKLQASWSRWQGTSVYPTNQCPTCPFRVGEECHWGIATKIFSGEVRDKCAKLRGPSSRLEVRNLQFVRKDTPPGTAEIVVEDGR